MAGKYLDDIGLSELWKKVKERSIPVKFLNQNEYNELSEEDKYKNVLYVVEGGETRINVYHKDRSVIVLGDTIVDKDGSINVKTPVNGVITQEDFDELPSEKRNNGLWVIEGGSDGQSPALNGEVYSTEERRIGTWIDGKPLYRRTFECTSPYAVSTDVPIITDVGAKIEYVSVYGVLIDPNNVHSPINFYSNFYGNQMIVTWYLPLDEHVHCMVTSQLQVNRPMYVTLEYTKATDKPNSIT